MTREHYEIAGYGCARTYASLGSTTMCHRRPAGSAGAGDPGVVVGAKRTVVGRMFEHSSIPATVTKQFIGDFDARLALHSRQLYFAGRQ